MSALNRDSQSFKKALARQEVVSWHSSQSKGTSTPTSDAGGSGTPSGEANKKKKTKSSAYYAYTLAQSGVETPCFRCRVFSTTGYRLSQ